MDDADRTAKTIAETQDSRLTIGHSVKEATRRAWDLCISAVPEGSAEPAISLEPGQLMIDAGRKISFAQTQSAPFTRPDIAKLLKGLKLAAEDDYPAPGALSVD